MISPRRQLSKMSSSDLPVPLISVVVVNWNGAKFLPECLQSLGRQTWPNKEFIIVDNGSTDNSVEILRQWTSSREDARVIWLDENTGFTRANNSAFKQVRGEWIALFNNDAIAEPDWLSNLVRRGNRGLRIGMIGSKILLADRPGVIDKAGHLIYRDGQNRGRGTMEPRPWSDTTRTRRSYGPTPVLPSTIGISSRKLAALTSGFFAYADDADLGMRARLLGWRGWLAPNAVVYHRHSATAGAYSPLKVMLVERNRMLLALKNFPLPLLLQAPLWTVYRYGWHLYAALTRTGSAGQLARGARQELAAVRQPRLVVCERHSAIPVRTPQPKGHSEESSPDDT